MLHNMGPLGKTSNKALHHLSSDMMSMSTTLVQSCFHKTHSYCSVNRLMMIAAFLRYLCLFLKQIIFWLKVPFWDNVTVSPLVLLSGRPLDIYTIRCGSEIEIGWPFLDTGWVVYDTPPVSHSRQLPLLLLFLSWLSAAFPGCWHCQ